MKYDKHLKRLMISYVFSQNGLVNVNQALDANVPNDKKIIYSDMQTITNVQKSSE